MAYRSINQSFSDDEYLCTLPKDGKLLALALILCKASHFSGLYHVRADVLAVEWGFQVEEVTDWLQRFTADGWAYFDVATNTVWVRSMFAHQTYQDMTAPQCQGAVKHLKTLRQSVLLAEWWHYYQPALEAAGFQFPWGTLPPTLGDTLSTTLLGGWGGSGLGLGLSTNKVKDKGSPAATAPGVAPPNAPLKVRVRSKAEAVKKALEKSPVDPKSAKVVRRPRRPPTDWTKVPVTPEARELAEHLAGHLVDIDPTNLDLSDKFRENTLCSWGKALEPVLAVLDAENAKKTIDYAMNDLGDERWKGWRAVIGDGHSLFRNWQKIRNQMGNGSAIVSPSATAPPNPFAKKEVAK